MIITNSRYALVGYFITSYPTRAHGIIVICSLTLKVQPQRICNIKKSYHRALRAHTKFSQYQKCKVTGQSSNLPLGVLTQSKLFWLDPFQKATRSLGIVALCFFRFFELANAVFFHFVVVWHTNKKVKT